MRTCYTGQVCRDHLGQTVTLYGWVNRRRDHGGVIFIDLRDRAGLAQIVFDPDNAAFATAERLRNEFCIRVTGLVRERPAGTANAELASGEVEVLCKEVEILNASVTPPFQLDDDNLSETTRLTHRVLDLRRPQMQRNLMLRYRVSIETRKFLDELGFIDIETPMLAKSTPEGARDYLVPSRVNAGHFFALPQSPQLFKQMLMVSGFDRYYQITKCFRDEDLRADRQPEFTQIDCETSFLNEIEIREIFENLIRHVFKVVQGVDLPSPFPIMPWTEAMRRYGSDKPDLRVQLEFTDITDVMRDVDFKVFAAAATAPGSRVVALRVPGGAEMSRSEIDAYTQFVGIYGAKGLAYIKIADNGEISSPIQKFFSEASFAALVAHVGAGNGDIVFFGAGGYNKVSDFMGALRLKAGKDFGLVADGWAPLWVTDFPMFEWDEEEQRYVALHHPFTAPAVDDIADLRANARTAVSRGYDMVLNGNEIGGGSIRIHRPDMQSAVFELLGIGAEEARAKFGFLLDALNYGAPPHGGIAFGIDRIAALMAGTESIRDVIPFPKTTGAQDLMTDAPSPIVDAQLAEVHIQVRPKTN